MAQIEQISFDNWDEGAGDESVQDEGDQHEPSKDKNDNPPKLKKPGQS